MQIIMFIVIKHFVSMANGMQNSISGSPLAPLPPGLWAGLQGGLTVRNQGARLHFLPSH